VSLILIQTIVLTLSSTLTWIGFYIGIRASPGARRVSCAGTSARRGRVAPMGYCGNPRLQPISEQSALTIVDATGNSWHTTPVIC